MIYNPRHNKYLAVIITIKPINLRFLFIGTSKLDFGQLDRPATTSTYTNTYITTYNISCT